MSEYEQSFESLIAEENQRISVRASGVLIERSGKLHRSGDGTGGRFFDPSEDSISCPQKLNAKEEIVFQEGTALL